MVKDSIPAFTFKAGCNPAISWANAKKISEKNYYTWYHRMSDFNAKMHYVPCLIYSWGSASP